MLIRVCKQALRMSMIPRSASGRVLALFGFLPAPPSRLPRVEGPAGLCHDLRRPAKFMRNIILWPVI